MSSLPLLGAGPSAPGVGGPVSFVTDSFTDVSGTALASHIGETGATWTKHTSYPTGSAIITDANRVRTSASGISTCYYASGLPATADYDVAADFVPFSILVGSQDGIVGRVNTAANTMYQARYSQSIAAWELVKIVTGTGTSLGTFADALTGLPTRRVTLRMRGTTISVLIDGTQQITAIDAAISTASQAGIRISETGQGNTTGIHLDNFTATNA